jgi:peptidoglycan/xylan/chitin deacetylase (PgdA/CDA1 family)
MTWADLGRAREAGFEIGAHTRTHPWLTSLDPDQLADEITGCVDRIVTEIGKRPRHFAYPYGDLNDRVVRVARDTFELSVTTELRPVEKEDDHATLPRLDAWYFRKPGSLESWGTAAFRRRLWIRAQGRRMRALMPAGARAQ